MTAALVVAFIAVPLAELYLIAQVSHVIGLPATLGILFVISIAGGVVVRREGWRTWQSLRAAVAAGRLPGRELADSALVLVGGALLLTPGFLTDAVGLLLVLPPTRALARLWLRRHAARRIARQASRHPGGHRTRPVVVDAEVVERRPPERD